MPLGDFRDMAREAINAAPKGEEGKEPSPEELERQVRTLGRHGNVRLGMAWHGM